MSIKPINVVLGLATFIMISGFVCLIMRLAFGFVVLSSVAIGLFISAFIVACIPLIFSFLYVAYSKIKPSKE